MNESQRLAAEIHRALEGAAWHGPSWREVLSSVSWEAAAARPIPGAHTIAEIVQHAMTWQDVVRQRLLGESPQVSGAEDWPVATLTDEAGWAALRDRLLETGRMLEETIAAFPPERLHHRRPGLEDTWYGLIMGELQHILYHAGQVPILYRAASAGS